MNNYKPQSRAIDATWTPYGRPTGHARRYPGARSDMEHRNRIANAALYAASTVGIVAALFFLLTL